MADHYPLRSEMTRDGQKIGKYILQKKLGNGQFGAVWKAENIETHAIYAIKKIERNRIDGSSILKRLLHTEVSIMHQIDHPNILHLHEFLISKNHYYLVIDYCNQGDFENYMREKKVTCFEEYDAIYFFKQCMLGFYELRGRKILHRDFKLANIFVHDERLVIGDFGFAKSGQEITGTKLGSPLTMAPELLFSNGEGLVYNSKADLWSVGVVFYQMLFGKPPFWGKNIPELKKSILENNGNKMKFPKAVSKEAKDLLSRLLTMDPAKRIEWREFFNHEIFVKYAQVEEREVKRVFGHLGLMQSIIMRKEFQKKQQRQDSEKDIKFYDEDEFANIEPQIDQQKVSEEEIDDSMDDRIKADYVAKEAAFRYSHEINKVFFLIYAVRKLQSFLKENCFPTANPALMNSSLLILKKAILINSTILEGMRSQSNTFTLNKAALSLFFKSEHYEELCGFTSSNRDAMGKHLFLMLDRAKASAIPVSNEELIASKSTQMPAVNKAIANEFSKIKSLKIMNNVNPQPENSRQYYLLLVLFNYAYNLNDLFPYLSKTSSDPKYNWNGFYYTLERATDNELKILI